MVVMTILAAVTEVDEKIAVLNEVNNSQNYDLSHFLEGKASMAAFLAMMYLFIASYALTWGPMGWLYPAELYSQGR